ncbi:hypothetical protein B0H13DRAFT_76032 [Mycena leptocephala]|nr:hypothetical protein B0H13DRAFT_76032 [Mycena leptocephala]
MEAGRARTMRRHLSAGDASTPSRRSGGDTWADVEWLWMRMRRRVVGRLFFLSSSCCPSPRPPPPAPSVPLPPRRCTPAASSSVYSSALYPSGSGGSPHASDSAHIHMRSRLRTQRVRRLQAMRMRRLRQDTSDGQAADARSVNTDAWRGGAQSPSSQFRWCVSSVFSPDNCSGKEQGGGARIAGGDGTCRQLHRIRGQKEDRRIARVSAAPGASPTAAVLRREWMDVCDPYEPCDAGAPTTARWARGEGRERRVQWGSTAEVRQQAGMRRRVWGDEGEEGREGGSGGRRKR